MVLNPVKEIKGGSTMKHCKKNALMMLLLLIIAFSGLSFAEERQVYAAQDDVVFFKENGKIGLQTTEGIVLHKAEFDGAGYFDATQQANIYVCDKIGRIDRSGKIIISPFECDEIQAIPTNAAEDVSPYVLLVTWYSNDGEKIMQLMDLAGNWLSDTRFDLMMYEFWNGKLFIRYENQYNQIDTYGQLTSEVWWDYLFVETGEKAEARESLGKGYLSFTKDGDLWQQIVNLPNGNKEIYLIQEAQPHLAPKTWTKFEWISDQLVAYCENDLWGISDYAYNIIMPAQWLFAPDLINGDEDIWLVVDSNTGEWKWIHSNNENVLKMAPGESMVTINESRCIVYDNGEARIIDNSGNVIAEINSHFSISWSEDPKYLRYNNYYDGIGGFISLDGEVLSEFPFALYEYHDGYTELTNGLFRVIDEERYEGPLDDPVEKCGFVSVDGYILLSAEWDAVYDFTANMLARVQVDGRYGYIDTAGNYVIEPQWEYADDYINAGDQWIAVVYEYSESGAVTWKGFINGANELIGEISYRQCETENAIGGN